MPVIPEFEVGHTAFEGGEINPQQVAAPGFALEQAAGKVSDQLYQIGTMYAEAKRQTLATDIAFGAMSKMQDAADKWRNTPDAGAASQGFMADAAGIKAQALQGINDPELQKYIDSRLSEHALTLERQTSFAALDLENAKRRGDLLNQLDTQANQAGTATDPDVRASYVSTAHAAISGAVAAGWLHGDDGFKYGKTFDNRLGSAALIADASRDPIGTATAFNAGKYDNLLDPETKVQLAPRFGAAIGKAIATNSVDGGISATGTAGNPREMAANNPAGMMVPGTHTLQQFPTPEAGITAISHQLDRYASGATTGTPLTTLNQIIPTWAPASDNNDTPALIARAVKNTGFAADQPLNVSDPAVKEKLVAAMIRGEQGDNLPVSPDLIHSVITGQHTAPDATPAASPTLTGMYGRIDAMNLDPIATLAAKTAAESQYRAIETDYARQRQLQIQQAQDTSRDAENAIIADRYSAQPKISAQQIADDPHLLPDAKLRMLSLAANAGGGEPPAGPSHLAALDLLQRMRLPDGDPNKITGDTPIYDALTKNRLTKADFDFVKHEFDQAQTPGGEIFAKRKAEFLKSVTPEVDPRGVMDNEMDPQGGQRLYQLDWALGQKANQYRAQGKDPLDLLDPSKPDYMGKPEALRGYRAPFLPNFQDAPSAATAVTPQAGVVPRQAGETPADYLARIGRGSPPVGGAAQAPVAR